MLVKDNKANEEIEARIAANKLKLNGRIYEDGVELTKGDVMKRYYSARNRHYFYGAVSFFMTAMFYVTFTSPGWIEKIGSGNTNSIISAGIFSKLPVRQ